MEEEAYREMYVQEDVHWWFRGRRDVIWALLHRTQLPAKVRLLDAGCGTGRNLVEFGSLGSAAGVDPSPEAVAFCHDRGLDDVRQAGIEALPFGPDEFDLVLALDVLEHVEDDLGALVELRRVASAEGLLLITVPASYFNSLALPLVAGARVAERRSSRTGRTDLDRTPAALNGVLELPMKFEAWMIRHGAHLPAGVSIGMLCRNAS